MNDATQTAAEAEAAVAAAQAPKNSRRAAVVNDEDALLEKYELGLLPVMFAMRNGNEIIQEKEPCFLCAADGFYGRGTHGTFHQEGEILVLEPRFVPNQHLQPLNRAAAISYARWLETLPANQVPINIDDMAEASQMLARDPRVKELAPDDYQQALIALCVKVKLKREGKDARTLPNLSPHNFAPQSGGNSPPILGARMSDMGQRTPGFNASGPGAPSGASGVRRAHEPAAALGGHPAR